MGGTYYEVMIQELNDLVIKVDRTRDEIKKLDRKMLPFKEKYRKISKTFRKKLSEFDKNYQLKHNELWTLLGSEDFDSNAINNFYRELNKLHLKTDALRVEYNNAKREHVNNIKNEIIAKRNLNKEIPVLTERIFKRIRAK